MHIHNVLFESCKGLYTRTITSSDIILNHCLHFSFHELKQIVALQTTLKTKYVQIYTYIYTSIVVSYNTFNKTVSLCVDLRDASHPGHITERTPSRPSPSDDPGRQKQLDHQEVIHVSGTSHTLISYC